MNHLGSTADPVYFSSILPFLKMYKLCRISNKVLWFHGCLICEWLNTVFDGLLKWKGLGFASYIDILEYFQLWCFFFPTSFLMLRNDRAQNFGCLHYLNNRYSFSNLNELFNVPLCTYPLKKRFILILESRISLASLGN